MRSFMKKTQAIIARYAQALVVLIAFALMVLFSYLYVSETERGHLRRSAEDAIHYTEANIKSDMQGLEVLLGIASQTISDMLVNGESSDTVNEYILFINNYVEADSERHLHGATGIFGVFDVFDGMMLIGFESWIPPDDYYETDRLWYTGAVKAAGELHITEPYLNAYSNETTITLSRMIFDRDGNSLGIVCLNIELTRIAQYVVGTQFVEGGYGFLLSENHIIIAHPNSEMVSMPFRNVKSGIVTFLDELLEKGRISEVTTRDYRGVQVIVFIEKLYNGWYMGVVTSNDAYFQSTKDLAVILAVLGLIFSALLVSILLRVSFEKAKTDERMKLMFNSTPLVAYILNENFKVIDCNQNAVTLFDLSSKQEFCDRFFDLLPEYQPNGRLTTDIGNEYTKKMLDEGHICYEWTYRKLNGELIPCEITCTRVMHKNDFTIVGYMRDLREQKKMLKMIEKRTYLLDTVNSAATILLSGNNLDSFENSLLKSFALVGQCLDVDRVQIWRNEVIDDDLHFVLRYEWLSDHGKSYKQVPIGLHFPYSMKREWEALFSRGEFINAPVCELSEEDQALLGYYGMKSIVMIPMFLEGDFWGLFSIDDCRTERKFFDEEISILSSAGLMMSSAVNRNMQAVKIREANEHIQSVFDAAPLAITMWDPTNYELINCNMEALRLVGITDKKAYMEKFAGMATEYQPNGRRSSEMLVEIFDEAMRNGICRHDWTHRTIDGEVIPFHVNAVRLRYMDDYIIISYAQDMREITAAMVNIRESEERAHIMIDAAPLCACFWDENLRIIDCNQEAVKLFGLSDKQEFLDKFHLLSSQYQPDGSLSSEKGAALVRKALEEGYSRFEWTHRKLNGERIPAEIICVRVKYREEYTVTEYIRDLREQKAMIAEMRKAEIAEESSKAKSDFLAKMSHEIRTPMNAILGITEIQLQHESLPQETKDALIRIYNSGDMLLGIINDILDLSKIESGKLEIVPVQYDIASFIHDTVQINIMRFESKPIEFMLEISEDVPSLLIGDELRIKEILNNLISNAFKYTDKGMVSLTVSVEPIDNMEDDVMLIFCISDTGQGMTEEQITDLGSEYARFNMETNRKTEGTGLGMNITMSLIYMMDGDISIDSTPGMGSTFTVKLPQKKSGSGTIGRELAGNLMTLNYNNTSKIRTVQINREFMPYGSVLVVDDVETNLYVAKGLLSPYGLSVDAAFSGFEAVEKIREGNTYDIIFMDHMMPKMDGIEAAGIIRGTGYTKPIVALTANAIAGQAEMFLNNGFDDFISKPIDIRQLNAVLNKLIRDKQPPEVIEESRRRKGNMHTAQPNTPVNSQLTEFFLRDAKKAALVLETVYVNKCRNDDDMSAFIVNIHAMKSALANIRENDLSAGAAKLEQAGRDRNINYILNGLPAFLEQLHAAIKKYTPDEVEHTEAANADDIPYLKEKLLEIKTACAEYNKKAAKAVLARLGEKTWPPAVRELLGNITGSLLHSEFDEIAKIIDSNIQQF